MGDYTPTPARGRGSWYAKTPVPATATGRWVHEWDDIAPEDLLIEWERDDEHDAQDAEGDDCARGPGGFTAAPRAHHSDDTTTRDEIGAPVSIGEPTYDIDSDGLD